jgi:hypothetical protein
MLPPIFWFITAFKWCLSFNWLIGEGLQPFPGQGRPRDEELARLRKEVKDLRMVKEILKKVAVIFAQGDPRDGVPVHTDEAGPVPRQGDDQTFGVSCSA